MTYPKIVRRIVRDSDLAKCGVRYRLEVRPGAYILLINRQQFDSLPEANRLIATAEITKIMQAVRALNVNCWLGETDAPI